MPPAVISASLCLTLEFVYILNLDRIENVVVFLKHPRFFHVGRVRNDMRLVKFDLNSAAIC